MACDLCTGCWRWDVYKYGLVIQLHKLCIIVCEHDDNGVTDGYLLNILARFLKSLYTRFIFVAV